MLSSNLTFQSYNIYIISARNVPKDTVGEEAYTF